MVSNKNVERLENSRVKLTVTVDKKDVKNEYDFLIKEYSKNIALKGFRKGKVPSEVLERKFGDSLKAEASQKVMESSLQEVISDIDEKPLPYSVPQLENGEEIDLDPEQDFTFTVSYDVFPNIELGNYQEIEIEAPNYSISKEDEIRELDALREQNAMVMEKDDGTVEKDNIVTIDYWEIDEKGNEVPDSKREDYVFTVGSGYNLYKIDDDILGMKKGESKEIKKSFPEDFENKDLAGTDKTIHVEVKTIKERQIPELDDELAQDISEKYETLDDLKNDINKRLEESAEARLREIKVERFLDKLAEISSYEIPEAMLKAELEVYWRNFVNRFQANEEQIYQLLKMQGKSRQDLEEEWREAAKETVKKRLLMHALIEKEEIQATDEDLDVFLGEQAESNSMSKDEIKDYYEKNNMLDYVEHDLAERKLMDKILSEIKIKKGKKVKYLDLMQGNQ